MTRSNASCGVNHLFFFSPPLPSPPLSLAIAVLTFTQPQAFWVIQNVTQSLFVLIVSSGSRFTSSSPSTDANEWAASLDCQRWRWGESLVETCYEFFDTSLSAFWLTDVNPSQSNDNGQSELTVKTSKLRKARENAGDQVTIGFSFASDWSRERRECSEPITARSKAKTNAIPNYFWRSIKNCSMR